ncbi:MAG: hypothetical protein ACKVU0_11210 [Saprospiraceae bacterium]
MKNISETRMLLRLMSAGFLFNLVFGISGSFFEPSSMIQMTAWQFSDTFAIMASILASIYTGTRNENFAAAGFTMLSIAYGISFSSSSFTAVNEEIMATIILPLVPAMLLISACKLFPVWLRLGSVMVCIPFFFVYKNVFSHSYHPDNPSNYMGYLGIQMLGVLWSIFIWKDFVKAQKQTRA